MKYMNQDIKITAKRQGNAQALVYVNSSSGQSQNNTLPLVDLSKWYACIVNRNVTNTVWSISIYTHEEAKNLQVLNVPTQVNMPADFGTNPISPINIQIGGLSMPGLDMDLAIWHFFNTTTVTAEMISKSCADKWIVTV